MDVLFLNLIKIRQGFLLQWQCYNKNIKQFIVQTGVHGWISNDLWDKDFTENIFRGILNSAEYFKLFMRNGILSSWEEE